jgi:NAD(P)-dependent dehydrogenase (short-subunit alcohol dehydrogenase family)
MTSTAFITGTDRGLGLALAARLLETGWRVFAGQYLPEWPELAALGQRYPQSLNIVPLDVSSEASVSAAAQNVAANTEHVDLLINNAGVMTKTSERGIGEGQDFAEMQRLYNVNTLGPLRVVEAFLPLMAHGTMKRLCFVSSEAGSIGQAQRTSWFGYCMSKAALNMGVKILFNDLRPQGYIFRLYHPGWVRSYMSGQKNMQATLEPEEAALPALDYFLSEQDESRLVLRDYQGNEWSW